MKRHFMGILLCALIGILLSFSYYKTASAAGNNRPRVIVMKYEVEQGGLIPGEPSEVKITLKNTNPSYTAYSVLLTCMNDKGDVFAEYGTISQAYVDMINPGQEKVVNLMMIAAENLSVEYITCKLNISYVDDINGESISETDMYLPIKEDPLKIKRISVPQVVVVGESARISVLCENVTKEEAYNAQLIVKGSSIEDISADLGTVQKESRSSQEVYVTLNSPEKLNLWVEITYQDAQGAEYTVNSEEYQIEVIENDKINIEPIQTRKILGYLIGFVICLLVIVILFFRRKDT